MFTINSNQCCSRWLQKYQQKLKQVLRACSLKVRDAEIDSENSFSYSDLITKLADPIKLRKKPEVSELKFGHFFTDHMLKIFHHKQLGGWQTPNIIPFEFISLHPAAKVLHYAVELFEGMKVYRGVDGKIRMFRPELNMERMNASAVSSGLPTFDGQELIECLKRLVQIDQEWVPHSEASSLYIRPTLIGTDGTLGVYQSDSALLYAILCPVGDYFSAENSSISLLADPRFTRAWPGGVGDKKMGSNYGPTVKVQAQANRKGLHQVLWLYGPEHQLTEMGTMNIFIFCIDNAGDKVLITPPLNGLILPGITRQSIIQLCEQWREFRVQQRTITMDQIIRLRKSGKLLEIFGCGTACIICPVSSIEYLGETVEIPTMEQPEPLYRRLRDELLGIQYGRIAHPWAQPIE